MGDRTRKAMRELARTQLAHARRHRRTEDPGEIKVIVEDRYGKRLRKIFARQNKDMNRALEDFWRRQIERYS
jgi:hypothetical protein